MRITVINEENRVINTDKQLAANDSYMQVFVWDEVTNKYQPCFLTSYELTRGIKRALKNPEDVQDVEQFEIAESLVDKTPKSWIARLMVKWFG